MKIAIHYDCSPLDAARMALSAPSYDLPIHYDTSSHVFLLGPVTQRALDYINKIQGDVIFHVRSPLDMPTFPAKKENEEWQPIYIHTIFQDMETCPLLLKHSLSIPILALDCVPTPDMHETWKGLEYGWITL